MFEPTPALVIVEKSLRQLYELASHALLPQFSCVSNCFKKDGREVIEKKTRKTLKKVSESGYLKASSIGFANSCLIVSVQF